MQNGRIQKGGMRPLSEQGGNVVVFGRQAVWKSCLMRNVLWPLEDGTVLLRNPQVLENGQTTNNVSYMKCLPCLSTFFFTGR